MAAVRPFLLLLLLDACTIIPADPDGTATATGSHDTSSPWGDGSDTALWSGGAPAYHPAGYDEPGVHGPDMLLQVEDCRLCHGDDLTGVEGGGANETEVDCDSCHQAEWRTDCTYCHGGSLDNAGAPPRDIDGQADPELVSFGAHPAHVSQGIAAARDCSECHQAPDDVLSVDHIFDGTAGQAEVDFSAGLGAGTTWTTSTETCSNNYCHGDGRSTGSGTDDGQSMACDSCHGSADDQATWTSLSGEHRKHLGEDVGCEECHSSVASSGSSISAPALHVDGSIDVEIAETYLRYDGSTCTGLCHWKGHWYESW